MFINEEHEEAYKLFVNRSNISQGDTERESLFYLLAMLPDTRKHINDLYNFKHNWIEIKGLSKGWQTGGTVAITRLAFNLYNGFKGEDDSSCKVTPLDVFSSLGGEYLEFMFFAIKVRMGREAI